MEFVILLYWGCLIIGGIFLLSLGLLGHLGGGDAHVGGGHDLDFGGHDVDIAGGHDANVGHHGNGPGITPLSPFIISTFLTMFGAVGLAIDAFVPRIIGMPIAGASGFAMSGLTFIAMAKLLHYTEGSSHYTMGQLEGIEATATTPISSDGVGEVAYTAGGSRQTSPARSEDGSPIEKHATVRITKVVGSTLLVRPAVEERLRKLKP